MGTRRLRSGKISRWEDVPRNLSVKPIISSTRNLSVKPIISSKRNLSVQPRWYCDLDTERRRRDTLFSNILLSRHHRSSRRSLGANNQRGSIVSSRVSSSSPLLDDEDILCEILSRLPLRSLLRLKSVCKRWLSLIKHNRYFMNLHSTRLQSRPNILYIIPTDQTPCQCIFLADITSSVEGSSSSIDGDEEVTAEAIIRDVRMTTDTNWFRYDQVFKPVNGLVCFIDREAAAVRIYNVGTRQVSPWFQSTLFEEEKNRYAEEDYTIEIYCLRDPIFQFGFDPSTLDHKVFYFSTLARTQSLLRPDCESYSYESCEVLTIGRDTKWRRIHVVPSEDNQVKLKKVLPPVDMGSCRLYVNGTIYWLRHYRSHQHLRKNPDNPHDPDNPNDPEVIVAFDVGSEKYRVIPIPNFFLDEPREESFFYPIAMLELNGRVALAYRMSPYLLKLWILDDGVSKRIENCHGNQRNWSAETIKLPFCCGPSFIDFHAVMGTDQIVFECYDDFHKNLKLVSLYSYDRKKKTFKKIEIDGISVFPLSYSRSVFTTFTESLFSVA